MCLLSLLALGLHLCHFLELEQSLSGQPSHAASSGGPSGCQCSPFWPLSILLSSCTSCLSDCKLEGRDPKGSNEECKVHKEYSCYSLGDKEKVKNGSKWELESTSHFPAWSRLKQVLAAEEELFHKSKQQSSRFLCLPNPFLLPNWHFLICPVCFTPYEFLSPYLAYQLPSGLEFTFTP